MILCLCAFCASQAEELQKDDVKYKNNLILHRLLTRMVQQSFANRVVKPLNLKLRYTYTIYILCQRRIVTDKVIRQNVVKRSTSKMALRHTHCIEIRYGSVKY